MVKPLLFWQTRLQLCCSQLRLALTALMLNFIFCVVLPTNVFAGDLQCEQIRISAHPNYPPFHWVQDGKLVGASIEITTKILDELDIKWTTHYVGPWKRVLHQAESGNIDLIPALKISEERQRFLTFTPTPFYNNPIAVFSLNSSVLGDVDELADLKGLAVSINAGDKHGNLIDSFLVENNVVEVIGLAENFRMLELERVDYFVTGKQTALAYLNSTQQTDKFKIALEINNAQIHHGFSKRSTCAHLVDAFSEKLAQKSENGDIIRAIEYYKHYWFERAMLKDK